MEVDSDSEQPSGSGTVCKDKKWFEVKKWNAVALWAWDIVVDNCAICRSPHTPFKRNVTGHEKPFILRSFDLCSRLTKTERRNYF